MEGNIEQALMAHVDQHNDPSKIHKFFSGIKPCNLYKNEEALGKIQQ